MLANICPVPTPPGEGDAQPPLYPHSSDSIFDNAAHAAAYARRRCLPAPARVAYIEALHAWLPERRRSLAMDVGAGTGLFTTILATSKRLGFAQVTALEPAPAMADYLRRDLVRLGVGNVRVVLSRLEDFQLGADEEYELVFASEMIHLVDDVEQWVDGASRVLAPGGSIAIRMSSQAQLLARPWYEHFPRARVVDMHRNKSVGHITGLLDRAGYNAEVRVMDESCVLPSNEYFAMFASRSFSALHAISEEEYRIGLEETAAYCSSVPTVLHDYKMTLILATRVK